MDAAADSPPGGRRGARRVLFFAEAVTLAHVARPLSLARGLAARGHAPAFAVDARYQGICSTTPFPTEPLGTIPTARFLDALARGTPIYDRATLERYVAEDLAILERQRPDVVVGDFRLSLSVSARRLGIPYVNLSSAYWSPYARPRWHVSDLPWSRLLPAALGDTVFRLARPIAFRVHAAPMESVRRAHGLPGLGHDLRRVYTDGDATVYADAPELVPLHGAAPSHRHLGFVRWEPEVALPSWWSALPGEGLIYVTLGSSGHGARLPEVIEGLATLGRPVVVAGAGTSLPERLPPNVHAAEFLPGDTVARASALVVCNGGSPTSQQALAHGVPVLALPGNLDQVLHSSYLEAAGVGHWLRPRARAAEIARAARALLDDGAAARRARALATAAARHDPVRALEDTFESLLAGRSAASAREADAANAAPLR